MLKSKGENMNASSSTKFQKPRKVVDLRFEDYEGKMKAAGIGIDYAEHFMHKQLQKDAVSSLNIMRVGDELKKEQSRRKVDRVRWLNGEIITAKKPLETEAGEADVTIEEKGHRDDSLDNAILNGGSDVMTLSLYYRPCKNPGAAYYTSDGNPQFTEGDGHK